MARDETPGYGLKFPDAQQIRAKLRKAIGWEQGESLWRAACQRTGAEPDAVLDERQLMTVGKYISENGGAARSYGVVLVLRASSYSALSNSDSKSKQTAAPASQPL